MQPACAQVSAKSILTGALKPKRVNSSLQYAWPRTYHNKNKGKMLTLFWDGEYLCSLDGLMRISSVAFELASIRLTWTVQSIKTRAYVQISTRISPWEGPAC
ncbi:unnamed protein product [Brassica rapa subsp. trilocularis]